MNDPLIRVSFHLSGDVQGVGMRPRLKNLADECCLKGWVENRGDLVAVQLQGQESRVLDCIARIKKWNLDSVDEPVFDCSSTAIEPDDLDQCFVIRNNAMNAVMHDVLLRLPLDKGICSQCEAELKDPSNRRYQYPFISCHNCGPRLSVLSGMPYNRAKTSFNVLPCCDSCQREFNDPSNRRYYCEQISCPNCGPTLKAMDKNNSRCDGTQELIQKAVVALQQGKIVAIKSMSAFQLLVRAGDEHGVNRLRMKKHRPHKPFAILVKNIKSACDLAVVSDVEMSWLTHPARPIVLLERHQGAGNSVDAIAPTLDHIGVMLPSTGLQCQLMDILNEPLVCTSANRTDEPVFFEDNSTVAIIDQLADVVLTHNLEIEIPQDDSVVFCENNRTTIVRSGRGLSGLFSHNLDCNDTAVLAMGSDKKNSFCLSKGARAYLSPYIGEMNAEASIQRQSYLINKLSTVHQFDARQLVCDLHPNYISTRVANQVQKKRNMPLFYIQHHGAHLMAAALSVQDLNRYLAIMIDGNGWGDNQCHWGSEVYLIEPNQPPKHVAHLYPFLMPGGEQAIRQSWRMTLALLHELEAEDKASNLKNIMPVSDQQKQSVIQLLRKGIQCPRSRALGRLFDGVSALLCNASVNWYEGYSAYQLQQLAVGAFDCESGDAFSITNIKNDAQYIGDWRAGFQTLFSRYEQGVDPALLAMNFHQGIVQWFEQLAAIYGCDQVLVSGGCMQNRVLQKLMMRSPIEFHWPQSIPVNDGSIALGQVLALQSGFYERQ